MILLIVLLLTGLASALPEPALAGMIGDPAGDVHPGEFNMGIEGDWVIHRSIDFEDGRSDTVNSSLLAVRGAYGFSALMIGGMPLHLAASVRMGGGAMDGRAERTIKGDSGFAIGGGLKASVYEFPRQRVRVGMGGQVLYLRVENDIVSADRFGTPLINPYKLIYFEKEGFIGADWRTPTVPVPLPPLPPFLSEIFPSELVIPPFLLYGGFLFSSGDGAFEVFPSIGGATSGGARAGDFQGSNVIGLFLGGNYKPIDVFQLETELHFITETSISLMAMYLF